MYGLVYYYYFLYYYYGFAKWCVNEVMAEEYQHGKLSSARALEMGIIWQQQTQWNLNHIIYE